MQMSKTKSPSKNKVTNEKPISLHGVNFKKLMAAFLKVKPESEKKAKKKPAK